MWGLPRTLWRLLTILTFGLLTACDGLMTGEKVAMFDLRQSDDGGFAPIVVSLGPEMGTIALNLRVEIPVNPDAAGKWNEYTATLTFESAPVAASNFNLNYTGTADVPGTPFAAQTVVIYAPKKTGDYTLTISATRKPSVALVKPQLELRKNINPPK